MFDLEAYSNRILVIPTFNKSTKIQIWCLINQFMKLNQVYKVKKISLQYKKGGMQSKMCKSVGKYISIQGNINIETK